MGLRCSTALLLLCSSFMLHATLGLDLKAHIKSKVSQQSSSGSLWELWGGPNEKLHETILYKAMERANDAFGSENLFPKSALKKGVRYNDLPDDKSENPNVKYPSYKIATRVLTVAQMTAWEGAEHKSARKQFQRRKEKASHDDMLYQSHFGCKQHWHSMAPFSWLQYPYGDSSAKWYPVIFTNGDVKELILRQGRSWFEMACNAYDMDAKHTRSNWLIGRIIHMFQDSFAMGHVSRDPESFQILSFQGYALQDGEKHAAGDRSLVNRSDYSSPEEAKVAQETRDKMVAASAVVTQYILEAWHMVTTALKEMKRAGQSNPFRKSYKWDNSLQMEAAGAPSETVSREGSAAWKKLNMAELNANFQRPVFLNSARKLLHSRMPMWLTNVLFQWLSDDVLNIKPTYETLNAGFVPEDMLNSDPTFWSKLVGWKKDIQDTADGKFYGLSPIAPNSEFFKWADLDAAGWKFAPCD